MTTTVSLLVCGYLLIGSCVGMKAWDAMADLTLREPDDQSRASRARVLAWTAGGLWPSTIVLAVIWQLSSRGRAMLWAYLTKS